MNVAGAFDAFVAHMGATYPSLDGVMLRGPVDQVSRMPQPHALVRPAGYEYQATNIEDIAYVADTDTAIVCYGTLAIDVQIRVGAGSSYRRSEIEKTIIKAFAVNDATIAVVVSETLADTLISYVTTWHLTSSKFNDLGFFTRGGDSVITLDVSIPVIDTDDAYPRVDEINFALTQDMDADGAVLAPSQAFVPTAGLDITTIIEE